MEKLPEPGARIKMKKNHPCGKKAFFFTVLRAGADIKIKCENCGHEIMMPRVKFKNYTIL